MDIMPEMPHQELSKVRDHSVLQRMHQLGVKNQIGMLRKRKMPLSELKI
jgi:hypothetical protein